MFEFDILLHQCGDFGRFQWIMLVINYSAWTIIGYVFAIVIFEAGTPKYACATSDKILSKCLPNNTAVFVKSTCYESNHSYFTNGSMNSSETLNCQFGFQYDCGVWENTITTEWDLVCDRRTFHSIVTMIFFSGLLVGCLVGGGLADRHGRRTVALIGSVGAIVSHTMCYFATNFIWYCFARFSIAFSLYIVALSTQIYNVESVGKKQRTWVGIFSNAFYGVGIMLLAFVAYYIRSWRNLNLFVMIYLIPFPILFYFFPESSRWLLVVRREEDAKKSLNVIAKFNRRELLDDETWDKFWTLDKDVSEKPAHVPSIIDFFKLPTLRMIQINSMFQWATTSLVFYGLTLNAGMLSGNIFINTLIIGIMDAGGCAISHPIILKFGCRRTLFVFMLISSIACFLSTSTISNSPVAVKLGVSASMIGKFSISAVFATVYLYAPEIFPTDVRSTTLGLSSAAARASTMLTPFVMQVQENIPWFSQVLFGCLALVASCLVLLLPETHNMPMLTTCNEAEEKYSSNSKKKKQRTKKLEENDPFI